MEGVNVRVVLVPLPYEGHLNPMLQLGSILHSKGFSVTVVHTHFSPPNPSHYPQFEFVSIPDGLSDREATSGDFMAVIASINNNCETALYESLVRVMGSRDGKIGCVIYDSLMYLTEAVARRLRLRSMVLRTCCVSHVMTYHVYHFLRERGDIPIQEYENFLGIFQPKVNQLTDDHGPDHGSVVTSVATWQVWPILKDQLRKKESHPLQSVGVKRGSTIDHDAVVIDHDSVVPENFHL